MVREIPPLRVLCLRKVGAHECNVEKTFAPLKAVAVNDHDHDDDNDNDDPPPPETKRSKGRKSLSSRGTKSSSNKKDNNNNNNNNNNAPSPPRSSAWQLLQSFHSRPSVSPSYQEDEPPPHSTSNSITTTTHYSLTDIPMTRMALVGKNASKRMHANDVDMNCPFVACRYTPNNNNNKEKNKFEQEEQPPKQEQQEHQNYHELGGFEEPEQPPELVVQYGNCALDCLQSYIDALTEQGRMDDTRLGKHFFQTWRQACLGRTSALVSDQDDDANHHMEEEKEERRRRRRSPTPPPPPPPSSSRGKKKRKRGRTSATTTPSPVPPDSSPPMVPPIPKLGSLSLHNCTIADRTINAMIEAQVGPHLAVLDMTGMQNMGDALVGKLLKTCTHLRRLSLKNCRRLSPQLLHNLATSYPCSATLTSLDIGGCINMTPDAVLEIVEQSLPQLDELNVGGLGWTNDQLLQLCQLRTTWKGLGIGFSTAITSEGLRNALSLVGPTLERLAIPFCEGAVDNALLGYLGKVLPHVAVLDIRGNANVNSVTGWFDGRAAARLSQRSSGTTTTMNAEGDKDNGNGGGTSNSEEVQEELFVLARYTSIHHNSIEETKRIHPLYAPRFECILDGEGSGGGIRR